MLGRKREAPGGGGRKGAPAKRRWQEELDNSDSDDARVTAEDLEQWRKQEEVEPEERSEPDEDPRAPVDAQDADPDPAKRVSPSREEEELDAANGADAVVSSATCDSAVAAAVSVPATADGGSAGQAVDPAAAAPLPTGFQVPVPPGLNPWGNAPAANFPPTSLAPHPFPPRPPLPPPPPPVPGLPLGIQAMQTGAWARPPAYAMQQEQRLVGRIKRYVDMPGGGGYGFIDCEETKLRFSRDVYIHKNQMNGLQIGDQVSFTIVRNNKGEPQARNVMRTEDALLMRTGGGAGLPGVAAAGGQAPASADEGLMDESQAKQFQAYLRGAR